MGWSTVVISLALLGFACAQLLPDARPCEPANCLLPSCRCSSVNIPGGLSPRDTPQFFVLTFDDAVNVNNVQLYRSLLNNRVNRNNCPAVATFFINHEYTDYTLVNELYNRGHEIALRSMSHRSSTEYWQTADYDTLMREFGDQKGQMAHFANIPVNAIHGIRSPFLQMSGNSTYLMMNSSGLTYDSSWPTIRYASPGLWPYTLHFRSTQDCIIPPCPTASLPGPWITPMLTWSDLQGTPCSMVGTCYHHPDPVDQEGWFQFILQNFQRQYLGNRAPFGFYVHEWYVRVNPGLRFALVRFLDLLNNLHDVYMVNAIDVVEWVKDPVPINVYNSRPCRRPVPSACRATSCGPLLATHTEERFYMRICNTCPRVYPWLGNPFGR